jgi:DNA-binding response OmpR family regulator
MPEAESSLPRLLIADDNVDAVKLLALLLRNHFFCVEAYTLDAVVTALDTMQLDVVLLDLTFQGTPFMETAKRIIALGKRLPPIVLLTGREFEQLDTVKELLRPYAYLKKPAETSVILMVLQEAAKTPHSEEPIRIPPPMTQAEVQ